MLKRILSVATRLTEAGRSVVGIRTGTEEPHFEVHKRLDGVEIRRYDARVAAVTTVKGAEEEARSKGFRRLAGYIFGANHDRRTIAMTAPVSQKSTQSAGPPIPTTAPVSQEAGPDGAWTIRFFMPAEWSIDTLPEPNDEFVQLISVPAETFAVLRFTGARTSTTVSSRTEELLRRLHTSEFEPAGTPEAWFYDPPWTVPFRRRNEVAVPVITRHREHHRPQNG